MRLIVAAPITQEEEEVPTSDEVGPEAVPDPSGTSKSTCPEVP